jgi:hypothetical protein
MDGYLKEDNKIIEMQELIDNQIIINNEITSLSKEITSLPKIPNDLEKWADSLADDKSFKLADFKKMFKFNKQYSELTERLEDNARKIRILAIDNLIDKIKNMLNK